MKMIFTILLLTLAACSIPQRERSAPNPNLCAAPVANGKDWCGYVSSHRLERVQFHSNCVANASLYSVENNMPELMGSVQTSWTYLDGNITIDGGFLFKSQVFKGVTFTEENKSFSVQDNPGVVFKSPCPEALTR
jgi:hypothetical protein